MKRSKRILALGAVLAAACIATFALTKYEEKQEEIQNSDEVILEIPADTVESLSWEDTENSLAFHKGDDGWLYDEDEAFPVSEEKITEILAHFESFGVSFIIENVDNYSQYGLDTPECVISLTTSDQSYELKLGDFSKMDEQRYVDIGDGNVYLVTEDPMDYLETELSSMILNDETADFETVENIQFTGSENYTITYKEESTDTYSEEDTYFTEKDGKTVPLDTDTVSEYLDTISSLSLNTFVTYNATQAELESYGLDEPELSVTVNYTYTDEEKNTVEDTCVLHISRNPEELKEAEEAEANEEEDIPDVTKYVRIGESQIVYELDDSSYEVLAAASYDDLRHSEVIWADSDDITQIDIALEGENHVITSQIDEEDEEKRVWYYGEEEIDSSDLVTALKALNADHFTDETADQKEEISLTVYLDNDHFPQVMIQLYRYDGTNCLAVVDGESISLVKRSSVMELVEAVQEIVLNR
ncbi:MAG: DUF4340 domain-containing protein [Lachnospiraceae bacterium]